ncbi:MAG: DUF5060 domain-containing protein [Verrucomicrobiota bacterium]
MNQISLRVLSFLAISSLLLVKSGLSQTVNVLGEKTIWHKITLQLVGPSSNEGASPNPFTNRRMDVTFTHPASNTQFVVPGFFAADGNAANTGATAGNKWHCYFRPNKSGTWNYSISFRQGTNVAMSTANNPGSPLSPYNGVSGSFTVSGNNNKTAPDLRAKGRLQYVGKHHLQFEGNGEYFLKFGPDSPENFLAFNEFDNTPSAGNKGIRHTFAAHAQHYQNDGQTWKNGLGKNILGAINYLASQEVNSISMLLYNVNGDGDRVFPYTTKTQKLRFDCSKLDQWEIVLDHAEKKGLYLHFKLSETENDQDHDGGNLGNQRKLYYREMIARFGHHLALNWNIAEEMSLTTAQQTAALQYFEANDPWQSNRVFHTAPAFDKSFWYDPHLGDSYMNGVSLQTPEATTTQNVFNETKLWVNRSANNGQPWIVACDEQGPGNLGVNASFPNSRKNVLWGNIMAGGAGVEYYSGGSDLSLDDYAHFEDLLRWSRIAINDFFYAQNIPFWNMGNNNSLTSNSQAHCLTNGSNAYVIYLRNGGTTNLNLAGNSGTFTVKWFDPRNGGALKNGSVTSIQGGGNRALGTAPGATGSDWAILVRKQTSTTPPAGLAWDDASNYQNQFFVAGSNLSVTVDYSAGVGNTVNSNGIKFWLRELRSDWSVVGDLTVTNTSVANTVFGTATGNLALPSSLTPTANLPAGNFYFLFVSFVDDSGTNRSIGIQPVVITSNSGPVPPAGVALDNADNYRNQTFDAGSDLTVTVDYSAGPGNTVDGNGIKFWLRHLRSDWSVVSDLTAFDTSAANTVSGTSTTAIALPANLTSSANLPAGDFYFLFVSFVNDQGVAQSTGTQPILIGSGGGGNPQTVTIAPSDDAFIQNGSALNNSQLRVQPTTRTSYLKFDVSGVSGTVIEAKLVLNVAADAGNGTLRVYQASSNSWTETSLSAANAPGQGAQLGNVSGSFPLGSDVEIDLGTGISNGVLSLVVTMDGGSNDVWFSSKEGAIDPKLEITYQP